MHVRLLLKQQRAPPGVLLPVQPVYFTSSHRETCSDQARARTGSPVSRLFVPITMATLCKQPSGCSSRSQTIFPAAGSHMNSAVHVPPSPPSACAPLHRKADFLPSFVATEPLPQAGGQLAAWHTLPLAKALPCQGCWQLHGAALFGFMRVPGVPKTLISGPGRADCTLGGGQQHRFGPSTEGKVKLAAGFRRGSAGHLHSGSSRCYGTS